MADEYPTPEDARAELVRTGGNAFAVAGAGDLVAIMAPTRRPMTRKEVANLVAWLTIVGMLVDSDIMPILKAQGYVLPTEEPHG